MTTEEIQNLLETLGNRVSLLSEENRICRLRDEAGKELISQLANLITQPKWIDLYESTENIFIRDLMKEWTAHLFPKNYKW